MYIYSLYIKPTKPIALQQHNPIIITIMNNGNPIRAKLLPNDEQKFERKWHFFRISELIATDPAIGATAKKIGDKSKPINAKIG